MNIKKLKKRNAKRQYEHRVNRKYKDSLYRKGSTEGYTDQRKGGDYEYGIIMYRETI